MSGHHTTLPDSQQNAASRVKLISVTPNAEKNILYCARVSSDQNNDSTGLINYLIRHNHWSPFELAHMVVEITTSRGLAPQFLRHRSFSFQEFSQRYASASNFIRYRGRRKGDTNRQGSIDDLDEETQRWWKMAQAQVADFAFAIYHEAYERGIALESARFVLPLSTETRIYMSGSLRSWIHYFNLRCDEHTQLEHREIAVEIREIFKSEFPIISDALYG